MEKRENQQRTHINKAFEEIPRFNGTNPSYCFDWLEQTEALVNEHQGRVYREELLLNCSTNVSKTIHALPQGATNQQIKRRSIMKPAVQDTRSTETSITVPG